MTELGVPSTDNSLLDEREAAKLSKTGDTPPAVSSHSSSTAIPHRKKLRNNLEALGFLLLLTSALGVTWAFYLQLHRIDLLKLLLQQPQGEVVFTFIGGNKNPFAIGVEIGIWGFVGVIARMAHSTSRVILKGEEFDFCRYLVDWIGTSLLVMGILTAVIFSLSIVSLRIAGVEITLADAPIEAIIALSFVLSFYHEGTQTLLSSLKGKIFYSEEGTSEQQAAHHDNNSP